MALRYKFQGDLPMPVSADQLKRQALMRSAPTVEFRSGADMKEVVGQVLQHDTVRLDAAVGSGKSTRFPMALAKITGKLVMHVVPNALLALDLYNYVVKQVEAGIGAVGPPLERWVDSGQQVPRTGVLFMSSTQLIQLIASRGALDQYAGLSVFLDEAHESDACTFLVRSLGRNLGMTRLIMASATFSAGNFRPRETPGSMVQHEFSQQRSPAEWRMADVDKPWSYSSIQDNACIFIDSRTEAARIKIAYEDMGIIVFRLEAGMDEQDFLKAMRTLRDDKAPIVVLLADYSFRSGFTFDVGCIIDAGYVSYFDETPGSVSRKTRVMCEFESYQAAGRGGRIKGKKCHYYRPAADYFKEICEVEGVEREAAAYICRILGFKPIGMLSATIMSKQDLPEGMTSIYALNSSYPITSQCLDSKGQLRKPVVTAVTGTDLSDPDKVVPVAAATIRVIDDSPSPPPAYTQDVDYKQFINSLEGEDVFPEVGTFMAVDGVSVKEPATSTFPRGLTSVVDTLMSERGPSMARALSVKDRKFAISLAVNKYNTLNVEILSIDRVLNWMYQDKGRQRRHKRLIYQWFEDRGRFKIERDTVHRCLDILTDCRLVVRLMAPFEKLIQQNAENLWKEVQDDEKSISADEYSNALVDAVEDRRSHRSLGPAVTSRGHWDFQSLFGDPVVTEFRHIRHHSFRKDEVYKAKSIRYSDGTIKFRFN